MKKLSLLAGLLVLALSLPVRAEESKAGGLEFSGNVDVVTGWQRDDGDAIPGTVGSGQLGEFRGLNQPDRDTFGFYIDQVELDLNKTFGERIRIRADLDFGRVLSGTTRVTESPSVVGAGNAPVFSFNNFLLEQGYVTVGIPGDGELLFGRFNVPIGYYLVDRADNPTISYPTTYQFVTPTNSTGLKAYWAFSDTIDLHVYVVNQLYDCLFTPGCLVGPTIQSSVAIVGGTPVVSGSGDSAIPSWGMRLGFNFGADEKKSTVGISYAGGPETPGHNAHLTHIFDLDFALKVTENLLIAGEGLYAQQNIGWVNDTLGTTLPNNKVAAGYFVIDWSPSETWDLFFSYGYMNDFQAAFTGIDQQIHNLLIGAGYQITDGAKLKLEYRTDIHIYANPQTLMSSIKNPATFPTFNTAIGDTTSLSYGVAAEFAYNF